MAADSLCHRTTASANQLLILRFEFEVCICKIMERMINNKLVRYLERNNFITPVQSGFRKQHCINHFVRLESFVWEAFVQWQHTIAIFFDLEKAYERTWKYDIMKDLHNAGLRGRLPCFIEGFLRIETFAFVSVHAFLIYMSKRWVFLKEIYYRSLCLLSKLTQSLKLFHLV